MKQLSGIISALITPMHDDYSININAIKKLVDMNLKDGIKGFFVCGSTGEGFLLSNQERQIVLEEVVANVAGKCPIIAHVGHISPLEAVKLARHASDTGADFVSSVMPIYYSVKFKEIKEYFMRLVDASQLPLIIYNISRAGTLTLDQMMELADMPGIYGFKYTSRDLFAFERLKSEKPDIKMFSGPDELYLCAKAIGADAAIGSTYNYMGWLFNAIENCYENGETQKAFELQSCANRLIQKIVEIGSLPCHKFFVSLRGVDVGICRPPFGRLDDETKKVIIALFSGLLDQASKLGLPVPEIDYSVC